MPHSDNQPGKRVFLGWYTGFVSMYEALNLVGQKYDHLIVMEMVSSAQPQQPLMWRCRCDCGNIIDCTADELMQGQVCSCGCQNADSSMHAHRPPARQRFGMVNDTNISRITATKPTVDNKLGLRGVYQNSHGRYVATISYKKHRTYLGTFHTAEQAKAAYDEAWEARQQMAIQEAQESGLEWVSAKQEDITGQKFGKLTAMDNLGDSMWRCVCDCGGEKVASLRNLKSGAVLSCGCLHHVARGYDLTGQRFEKLTVIGYAGQGKWTCSCDCGNVIDVRTGSLKSGRTRSCGCLKSTKEKFGMVNDTSISKINAKSPSASNKLGMRGVYQNKNGRYVASISYQKKRTYLGTFDTAAEAKEAYDKAWEARRQQAMNEGKESGVSWPRPEQEDITGQKFGKLTAVEDLGDNMWRCACECGGQKIASLSSLKKGAVLSCGCLHHVARGFDLTGHRFGKLTVVEYAGAGKWTCRCDCGNVVDVRTDRLKSGHTRSCGCLRKC